MSFTDNIRRFVAAAHLKLLLRWPTLLAIAVCGPFRHRPRASVRSILLVRLDGLGDCVLALPLAEALARCFPDARLTVVTQPSAVPLFGSLDGVDEVIAMPLPWSARAPKYLRGLAATVGIYARELRGRDFDVVVMPRWDADIYHATLLCALTRAAVSVGYADSTSPDKLSMNRGFQRAWSICLPPGPLRHEVLRNLETAHAIGCDAGAAPCLRLPLDEDTRKAARDWLSAPGAGFIGVGLSSAEAKKRWGAQQYIAVLNALHDRTGLSAILFADRDTAALGAGIHAAVPSSRLAQQMPLLQVAGVLGECRIFLGNDSGLGHIAAAVGCPTMTIFSQAKAGVEEHRSRHSTSPERFRPFGPHTTYVQPERARPGCEGGCRALEPHCILAVTPEAVAAAVLALLDATQELTVEPHAARTAEAAAL